MKLVLGAITPAVGISPCKTATSSIVERVLAIAFLAFLVALSAGCSSTPKEEPQAAPPVEALSELMSRAEGFAAVPNGREQAREAYRQAAKAYPTSKQPWNKLGESYFDAKDYGNAILAAQEVLEREPTDRSALGILAVSGLRVSSQALFNLRTEGAAANGSIRTEAESLASTLRGVLGESVLFPQPPQVAQPVEPPPAKLTRRVRRAVVTSSPTDPVVKAESTAPVRTVSSNPFDRLK